MFGRIFGLKRFEIHDGDGIRSTLFLKGCPLSCKWCHNPEGQQYKTCLGYVEAKCINCGECVSACPSGAHVIEAGNGIIPHHVFKREKCIGCGSCEKVCLGRALTLYGRDVTCEEILPKLLEDKDFYAASGGGVTISGGEPAMQADFTTEILQGLKHFGIHTALDTCGYAPFSAYEKMIPYTDLILYDLKAVDSKIHEACTGKNNDLILDNLFRLDKTGVPIDIRIPFVQGLNDGELEPIAKVLSKMQNLRKSKILPYHTIGISKYLALGMDYSIPDIKMPNRDTVIKAVKTLRAYGINATDETGNSYNQ